MKYSQVVPSVIVALGLTGGIASAATQSLDVQPTGASLFQMTEVSSHGLLTANKDAHDKCGKGACGSAKPGEHKDADHKCGSHKDGEHKCGSDKKGDHHDEHHKDGEHHDEHKGEAEKHH